MAIAIDWDTRVISVPKADMALIQSTPIEVRELDINAFRLALKDLEDDDDGVVFIHTHNHNPPVAVGGIELARVVEIINGYTVTFEDGAYIVNLAGANSNISDRVNPNNVSIRTANSAGLLQSREIEQAAFDGCVTIDAALGTAGTLYPIGTNAHPVNNLADAQLIAVNRGIERLCVQGTLAIGAGEVVSGYQIHGTGATLNAVETQITFSAGASASNTSYKDLRVDGVLAGESLFEGCVIGSISNAHCVYRSCALVGPMIAPASIGPTHVKMFEGCYSSYGEFTLDQNGSQLKYIFQNFLGRIKFINGTHAGAIAQINLKGGTVTIDSSCTAGTYVITGQGTVINNSTGTALVDAAALPTESADGLKHTIESLRQTHQAFGQRFFVDPENGRDTNAGTTATTAFATFAAALAACVSGRGDTIILLAPAAGVGNIAEQVLIDKEDIHVRGPGRGFQFQPAAPLGGPVITVTANNCSLAGFVVRAPAGSTVDDVLHVEGKFFKGEKLYLVGPGLGVGTSSGFVIRGGDYHELINCESEKYGGDAFKTVDAGLPSGSPREISIKGGNYYLASGAGLNFTSNTGAAVGASTRLNRVLGVNIHDNGVGIAVDANATGTTIDGETMLHSNGVDIQDASPGLYQQTTGGLTALQSAMLAELHKIHGLLDGSPLVVTSTARQAGGVEQTISTVGDTVTVTRT